MWNPVLPYLSEHYDARAVAMPGHHDGVSIPDVHEIDIVETLMDLLEAEIDKFGWGEQYHVVGNSLGGWAALLLANRGRAISTVAISPGGGWELGSYETKRVQRIFRQMELQLKLFKPIALELAARPRGRMITHRDAVAFPARMNGAEAVEWIHAAADCPARKQMLPTVPDVKYPEAMADDAGPIRIAWGTKDRILPYNHYATGWRKVLPDADWVTLEGLGHVPMSDDPELIAQTILEFTTAASPAEAV
jgi:pimeloyl-ACP methyl ester carboxylesterase